MTSGWEGPRSDTLHCAAFFFLLVFAVLTSLFPLFFSSCFLISFHPPLSYSPFYSFLFSPVHPSSLFLFIFLLFLFPFLFFGFLFLTLPCFLCRYCFLFNFHLFSFLFLHFFHPFHQFPLFPPDSFFISSCMLSSIFLILPYFSSSAFYDIFPLVSSFLYFLFPFLFFSSLLSLFLSLFPPVSSPLFIDSSPVSLL